MNTGGLAKKCAFLTRRPGVYQMLDKNAEILYVGKAKNLKKRVLQYFQKQQSAAAKTRAMVAQIVDFEVVVTPSEAAALILENELIKKHKPRYNIRLKDAKSYPYLFLSKDPAPRIGFYRGGKKENFDFFGPFPNARVVKESIALLRKTFKIRQCTNHVYRARSRPCLEYQIGFCSAPCVGKISAKNYAEDVASLRLFLQGKNAEVVDKISQKMRRAATELDFERAAAHRDQITNLRKIQAHRAAKIGDMDIISVVSQDGFFLIFVLFVREGRQVGHENIFPKNTKMSTPGEVLSAFLSFYYADKKAPAKIIIDRHIDDKKFLEAALRCKMITTPKTQKRKFLEIAQLTAHENLAEHIRKYQNRNQELTRLQQIFALENLPERMECFDISHTQGEAAVAACVVFENGAANKREYRHFTLEKITPGDDCAAIYQAVFRRYSKLKKTPEALPQFVLIDGGLGQLNAALRAAVEINLASVLFVAIKKGEGRKPGLETLIVKINNEAREIKLGAQDRTLLFLMRIRDTAHRFAITRQRRKFAKKRRASVLENINGIGAKKRTALLEHFGALADIERAGVDEIAEVRGIDRNLALRITAYFRGGD